MGFGANRARQYWRNDMGTAQIWTVITTCTSKKRVSPSVQAADLPRGPQSLVLQAWLSKLCAVEDIAPLKDVYAGRGFQIAVKAAQTLGTRINVLSAGLGYLRDGQEIPGYDLTVSSGQPSSVPSLVTERFDPPVWWRGVQKGRFASSLTTPAVVASYVLVALSAPYSKLVVGDLVSLVQAGCELRLFGSSLAKHLPNMLHPSVLPYDERLSEIISGTKVDFPQRALLDYATQISPQKLSRADDQEAVLRRLAAVGKLPRAKPHRKRSTDAELRDIIRRAIPRIGHSKSKLLAHLRRDLGIACEQERFSRLFSELGDHNAV